MCTNPVAPSGKVTKAPNFVMPVTFPVTLLPTSMAIKTSVPPCSHETKESFLMSAKLSNESSLDQDILFARMEHKDRLRITTILAFMTIRLQIERNLIWHNQILMFRCVLFNIRWIIQLLLLFLKGLLLCLYAVQLILKLDVLGLKLLQLRTLRM